MLNIIQGDIATVAADAIINAANTSLLGGGGVDGAIHRAAGPELLAECRTIGGCPTGEARVTKAYKLKAQYIIHTVGPVWHGGSHKEDEHLASCYRSCFEAAQEYGIRSLAFPSISTGAYGFPVERASIIAVREIAEALRGDPGMSVTVVCFDSATLGAYHRAAKDLGIGAS